MWAGKITPGEIEYAKKVLASIDARKLKAADEAANQRQREERERTAAGRVGAKPQRKVSRLSRPHPHRGSQYDTYHGTN
jgi:sRNA-binding protein